ncbi:MAG: glycine zipper family protein [Dehalococcoidales bacterium]|nr:glycine zipper family protein [Dehalococcoidales bacterium]
MEFQSNWYDNIVKEINLYQNSLNKKVSKKYKLDLLLRIAKRVAEFSTQCGQCQMFQQDITTLTKELSYLPQTQNKEAQKRYFKTIGNITKHLQKQHKLVTKGQYIGTGMAIGAGTGVALGAALDNAAIGPALGGTIGLAIGSYLDKKAQKEDRVI